MNLFHFPNSVNSDLNFPQLNFIYQLQIPLVFWILPFFLVGLLSRNIYVSVARIEVHIVILLEMTKYF